MGVPIYGPSYIYGDTMSVIHNTQFTESKLKNNRNSICYRATSESVAMEEYLTRYVGTKEHCADLSNNVLYGGKRKFHV